MKLFIDTIKLFGITTVFFSCNAIAATIAGTIEGEGQVTPQGAFTYRLPLKVVPGTGGVEPELALVYSTRMDEGICGYGWSLDGFSTISRTETTNYVEANAVGRSSFDGTTFKRSGVNLSNNDRFALDGQRLVAVVGSYGGNNTEYRTEIDTFSRIKSVVDGTNTYPSYFTVESKSGLNIEYGNTSDSRVEAQSSATVPLLWAMNKVSDRFGNTATYNYSEDTVNGTFRLANIQYSYTGSAYTSCKVEFIYAERGLNYHTVKYISGSKVEQQKILDTINVYEGTALVRSYVFTYKYFIGHILLDNIEEQANGDVLPKTIFTYESDDIPWYAYIQKPLITTDDGDKLAPWKGTDNVPTVYHTADFNGDGRKDIICYLTEENVWYAHAYAIMGSAANSDSIDGMHTESIFKVNIEKNSTDRIIESDFNGDNKADILTYGLNPTKLPNGGTTKYTDRLVIYNSTGTTLSAAAPVKDENFFASSSYNWESKAIALDYNGDGLSDILLLRKNQTGGSSSFLGDIIFRSSGNGFTKITSSVIHYNIPYSATKLNIFGSDVNGDGMDDLVITGGWDGQAKVKVFYSDGNTIRSDLSKEMILNSTWVSESEILPTDITGDDILDFIYFYKGSQNSTYSGLLNIGAKIFIGTGVSSNGSQALLVLTDTQSEFDDYFIGSLAYGNLTFSNHTERFATDINGDGRTDIVSVTPHLGIDDNGSIGVVYQHSIFIAARNTILLNTSYVAPDFQASYFQIPMDINGDGKGDYVSLTDEILTRVNPWFSIVPSTRLTQVTDGLGKKTRIEYKPITSNLVYTPESSGTSTTISEFRGPYYVVSALKTDDGLTTQGWRTTTYNYAGAKLHRWGYGFLGFHQQMSLDSQTSAWTQNTFAQDFPKIGQPTGVLNMVLDPHATSQYTDLNRSSLDYDFKSLNGGRTYYPFVSATSSYYYEVSEDNSISPNYYKATSQNTTMDDWGNIATQIVHNWTGSPAWEGSVETVNTWTNTDSTWLLGKLTKSIQTSIRNGKSPIVREGQKSYDATTGALSWKKSDSNSTTEWSQIDYVYDAWGNITTETTTGYNITSRAKNYTYDSTKRFPLTQTNELGQGTSMTWNSAYGKPATSTDLNALVTTFAYDSFGRLKSTTLPNSNIVEQSILGAGTLNDSRAYALKVETTYKKAGTVYAAPEISYLDRLQRTIRVETIGGNGNQTIYKDTVYNSLGLTEKSSPPYFSTQTAIWDWIEYDSLQRPRYLKKAAPTDSTTGYIFTQIKYNGLQKTEIRDVNQTGYTGINQQSVESYNTYEQIYQKTDNLGNTITYDYDSAGNPSSITSGSGFVLNSMQYNQRGLTTQLTDSTTGTITRTYDGLGLLRTETDPDSVLTTYTYDKLNRLTDKVLTKTGASTLTYNWSYDTSTAGVGKIASESGPNNYLKQYIYISTGTNKGLLYIERPTIGGAMYSYTYSYDTYGRLSRTTYPVNFYTNNNYDAAGQISSVVDKNGRIWWSNPTFGSPERIASYQLGSGTTVFNTYNRGTDYLTLVQAVASGQDRIKLTYNYDAVGNMIKRKDIWKNLVESLRYDGLNRLIGTTLADVNPNQVAQSNWYDNYGNFTSKNGTSYYYNASKPQQLEYWVDPNGDWIWCAYNNRGETAGRYNFTTGLWSESMTWNLFGQPDSVTRGFNSVSFTYDNQHQRITENDGVTQRVYAGNLYEKWVSGGITHHIKYINSPSGIIGMDESYTGTNPPADSQTLLIKDHVGSSSIQLSFAGAILNTYSYNSWGAPRDPYTWADYSYSQSWPDYVADRGFTFHEMLEGVRFVNMLGRIYDPYMGRFISPDPVVQDATNLQNFSRYSYVYNNPHRYTDPTGHTAFDNCEDFDFGSLVTGLQLNPGSSGSYFGGSYDWYQLGVSYMNSSSWSLASNNWFTGSTSTWSLHGGGIDLGSTYFMDTTALGGGFSSTVSFSDITRNASSFGLNTNTLFDFEYDASTTLKGWTGDTMLALGFPFMPKPFVTPGAFPTTSLASYVALYGPDVKIPSTPSPVGLSLKDTASGGRLVSRYLPYIGAGLAAYDIYAADDPLRATFGNICGFGGGCIGGASSLLISSPTGPFAIGVGVTGSIEGSYFASKYAYDIYDWITMRNDEIKVINEMKLNNNQ